MGCHLSPAFDGPESFFSEFKQGNPNKGGLPITAPHQAPALPSTEYRVGLGMTSITTEPFKYLVAAGGISLKLAKKENKFSQFQQMA